MINAGLSAKGTDMPSNKKRHYVRNDDARHEAIIQLAELAGFKSVGQYLQSLIDVDAKRHGFEMPNNTTHHGGNRYSDATEE